MNETEKKLTIANKVFYVVLILLIFGSVGFTFLRLVIWKDYQIIAEVSCDPVVESCFHYEPELCIEDDIECVPEEAYDYKIINKKASTIYACEQTEEKIGCNDELSCVENEEDCSYTLCDPTNLGENEVCSIVEENLESETDIEPEEELE